MALLSPLSLPSEFPLPRIKSFDIKRTRKLTVATFAAKRGEGEDQFLEHARPSNGIFRRALIGLAAVSFSLHYSIQTTLADEGNGWWLDGPLPIPPVYNKIANEETGTRSFLKKGIYMADIGPKGSAYRLRKYAFDLIALGDLLGQDAWNYVRKYLRLKSTFMYYDFDKVISAAPSEEKQPLTDLANRLFNTVEKLEDAVTKHNEPQTNSLYQETTILLQEVMVKMA